MSKLARLIAATLVFTFALALPAHAQENAPEPEGYRADN